MGRPHFSRKEALKARRRREGRHGPLTPLQSLSIILKEMYAVPAALPQSPMANGLAAWLPEPPKPLPADVEWLSA